MKTIKIDLQDDGNSIASDFIDLSEENIDDFIDYIYQAISDYHQK